MNIALPALLLFLFILPGFIFNLAFYNTDDTSINFIPFTHKVITCILTTCALHTLWLLLILFISPYQINLGLILALILGLHDNILASISLSKLFGAEIYLLSMYTAAYFIGKLFRWSIKQFNLDKFSLFRLDNPWHYLLTGYDWEEGNPDGVIIAAIVEIANKGYLYTGLLEDYFLDKYGNIDRLVLTSAARREIENDKQSAKKDSFEKRFYSIDGDYFVLKYAEIKNLNMQFLKITDK